MVIFPINPALDLCWGPFFCSTRAASILPSRPPNRTAAAAQGLSRLAASSRPPEGLGLDWPEHGCTLDRIGAEGCGNLRWDGAGMLVILVLTESPLPQQRRSSAHPSGMPARRSIKLNSYPQIPVRNLLI